jgi:hypothetical protein
MIRDDDVLCVCVCRDDTSQPVLLLFTLPYGTSGTLAAQVQ